MLMRSPIATKIASELAAISKIYFKPGRNQEIFFVAQKEPQSAGEFKKLTTTQKDQIAKDEAATKEVFNKFSSY